MLHAVSGEMHSDAQIHEMWRSGANKLVKVLERIVLPRIQDVVRRLLRIILGSGGDDVEMLVLDFTDAFEQLIVAPNERRFLSGKALNGWFMYITVLFGVLSGPLLWGRVAASETTLRCG